VHTSFTVVKIADVTREFMRAHQSAQSGSARVRAFRIRCEIFSMTNRASPLNAFPIRRESAVFAVAKNRICELSKSALLHAHAKRIST